MPAEGPMTHTPEPWKSDLNTLVGPDRQPIAEFRRWTDLQHAIHCVNAHDALLAALEVAEDWLVNATFDRLGKTQEEYNAAVEQVQAAIKAAKGTG